MALVPLVWCALRRERRPEWWWLAGAFAISWVADTMAHFSDPWIPAAVYPMSQAAMVGTIFLPRGKAMLLVTVLGIAGIVGVAGEGVTGPDLLLQTVSFGSVVGIVWPLAPSRLRTTLLVAFGLGWLAWVGYLLNPGWATWGFYQAVRAVSLGMFCWANRSPRMQLA